MRKRSQAEWVTFAVSCAVLAVVVALIGMQVISGEDPPAPVARTGQPREVEGRWFVPVSVFNGGDATAEAVQVVASLVIGDDTHEADQVIDFLAGGETEEVEFVFEEDPGSGELEVRIAGYQVP